MDPFPGFQCSSASRKFLKFEMFHQNIVLCRVSVLFSEPKIPQTNAPHRLRLPRIVSVLFSEPKIPQN